MFVNKKTIIEAMIVCGVGLFVGFIVNYAKIIRVFTVGQDAKAHQIVTSCTDEAVYARPIGLTEVQQLSKEGAFLIDARPWELYMKGHIPGAVSISTDKALEALPTLEANIPKDSPVVVYCRGGQECTDSKDLGECLVSEGYENVKIFTGGISEWRASGLPVN